MKLSGEQRKKIQDALIDAFANKSSLEQMLDFELDKNLNAIAGEGSLQEIVFKLIRIAESQGWLLDLVSAARKSNPGNSSLQAIAQELFSFPEPEPITLKKIEKYRVAFVMVVVGVVGVSIVAILRFVPHPPKYFADVKNVPSGVFEYGGSTTWAPFNCQGKGIDAVIKRAFANFKLQYSPPSYGGSNGSNEGIERLQEGDLTFALSSRPLTEKEKESRLEEIPVALDVVAIVVHPDLRIPGLTLDQLKGIYTGKITNWNQINNNLDEQRIVPFSRQEQSGTVDLFERNILGGEPFSQEVKIVSSTTEGVKAVATQPGGIYYASAPEVFGQDDVIPVAIGDNPDHLALPYKDTNFDPLFHCQVLNSGNNSPAPLNPEYPTILRRKMFVVVKDDNTKSEQAGKAYAQLLKTDQGQDLIEQIGFERIDQFTLGN